LSYHLNKAVVLRTFRIVVGTCS